MIGAFPTTARAITEALLSEWIGPAGEDLADSVSEFVVAQHARMPDYLRLPLIVLTLACETWPLGLGYWRPLHRLPLDQRRRVIGAWKRSRLGFRTNLIKFYESLAIFGWASECQERSHG
jgi:hypothetical protein